MVMIRDHISFLQASKCLLFLPMYSKVQLITTRYANFNHKSGQLSRNNAN